MSKESWSKKEGLDLRWDKTKILKQELKEKGRNSKEIPVVKEPQVHKGKDNYLRRQHDGNDTIDHARFKKRILRMITRLTDIADVVKRNKLLRKIEGRIDYLLSNKAEFTEQEADKIVDAFMICRERNDPKHHPLQPSTISSIRKYKSHSYIHMGSIFSHAILIRSLNKKGFYVNHGPFSSAESLTLTKNFEKFLARHGRATDRDSIWKLLHDEFLDFYRRTQMFLYIGKNLNRTSGQMYTRLFSLYHPYAKGKSDAKTDAYILARREQLEKIGVHAKNKQIGEEINRFRHYVSERYFMLTGHQKSFKKPTQKIILNLITEQQNCAIKDIDATDVDLAFISKKLGVTEENFRSFWQKEGQKMCVRASLPKWRLEDSLALLKAIEDDEEDDENCIDFKSIYERAFQGKVQNWEHLREHYNKARRVVPYYMLKDLQSTVAAAVKEIKKKMEERKGRNAGGGGGGGDGDGRGAGDGVHEVEIEEDEDDFIE